MMKRSTLVSIRTLLLSDRLNYKGNELPGMLNIIAELNAAIKELPEDDDTDSVDSD